MQRKKGLKHKTYATWPKQGYSISIIGLLKINLQENQIEANSKNPLSLKIVLVRLMIGSCETFILDMMPSLGLANFFTWAIGTLFCNALTIVCSNVNLSKVIMLQNPIKKGFPFAPYLFFIVKDILRYLLEIYQLQRWIRIIFSPDIE